MQGNHENRLSAEAERERESQLLDLLAPFANCNPPFSYSAGTRCTERGLIPGCLLESLQVLEFLCATVLSAQKSQRMYGVRASVLLAMAIDESAFNVRNLTRERQIFSDREVEGHSTSPIIDQWFFRRAKSLSTKIFRPALNRNKNAKGYIESLCKLGYFEDSLKAQDLCSIIKTNKLEACDVAGMLPIGEYSRAKYEAVRDTAGNVTGLKDSAYSEFLREQLIQQIREIVAETVPAGESASKAMPAA